MWVTKMDGLFTGGSIVMDFGLKFCTYSANFHVTYLSSKKGLEQIWPSVEPAARFDHKINLSL